MEDVSKRINAAYGKIPCDLLLKGGTIINVFTGALEQVTIAVKDGRIVGYGDRKAKTVVDVSGKHLCPGLIDVHLHLESTLLAPSEITRLLLPRGTTTIVADPHEIANVSGFDGIQWMLEATEKQPLNYFFWLPSCVPATHLETSGAILTSDDLATLINHPRIVGMGEMMNVPGVVNGDRESLAKIHLADDHGKIIDGHAPQVSGSMLDAYLAAGISADHECTSLSEAREKLAKGMRILIREGSAARNLQDLLPLINDNNWQRISFVLDDRHVDDLCESGGLDNMIRTAIHYGIDPVRAISLASFTSAQRMGWRNRGHLGIGAIADIVVLEDIEAFRVSDVWKTGVQVVANGNITCDMPGMPAFSNTMNVLPFTLERFQIPDKGQPVKVIGLQSGQIITKSLVMRPRVRHELLVPDPVQDIAKIAVVERHKATGNIGLGFVRGMGLRKAAVACSIAHDSHNIIVAGMDDVSMFTAVQTIIDAGGGIAVCDGEIVESLLPLPIAGLMSDQPFEQVLAKLKELKEALGKLGANPDILMTISFLALPVIPELKLTDKGIVDVNQFFHVPLESEDKHA